MNENLQLLREQLEKCARLFHSERQVANAREHKFWKFENCPAESCAQARKALGMPTATLADFAKQPEREPGQEG